MRLTPAELVELYEAVIKTSGHPDPLGYMARVLLFSQGDPDYIDAELKQGFMPVNVEDALTEVGAKEVQSLQSNVVTTIAMDLNFFTEFGSIDAMIIAFHSGRDAATTEPFTAEDQELLDIMPDARDNTLDMMYPPLASVEDVITLLTETGKIDDLTKERTDFFKLLTKGGSSASN